MNIMTSENSPIFGALAAELLGAPNLVAQPCPTLATPAQEAGAFYFQAPHS